MNSAPADDVAEAPRLSLPDTVLGRAMLQVHAVVERRKELERRLASHQDQIPLIERQIEAARTEAAKLWEDFKSFEKRPGR